MATVQDLQAIAEYKVGKASESPGRIVWAVDGPGFSTQVVAREDGSGVDASEQGSIDRLADRSNIDRAVWFSRHPSAAAAGQKLRRRGWQLVPVSWAGEGSFTATPPVGQPKTLDASGLEAEADGLPPPPPVFAQARAAIIAAGTILELKTALVGLVDLLDSRNPPQ